MDKIETELGRSFFVAGDLVLHRPSATIRLLACDEDDDGNVHPIFWPCDVWKASDCSMFQPADKRRRFEFLCRSSDRGQFMTDKDDLARAQLIEILKKDQADADAEKAGRKAWNDFARRSIDDAKEALRSKAQGETKEQP